jgi:hypothetical protein
VGTVEGGGCGNTTFEELDAVVKSTTAVDDDASRAKIAGADGTEGCSIVLLASWHGRRSNGLGSVGKVLTAAVVMSARSGDLSSPETSERSHGS